ncbi:MAG: ketopantoate reductase family protein [Thermodesulfobacteriota bacterium]
MKTLIIGSGAVGGYFGALLVRAGNDVTFLARGEHLKAISRDGLTIKSINDSFNIKVNAIERPDVNDRFDLLIFSVKGYDLNSACDSVKAVVGDKTTILSLLNGVESEEFLGNRFGIEKVVGGVAFIGSTIESPGIILHTAAGFITFGEMDGRKSTRGKKIKEMFKRANIPCSISGDINRDIWSKMVWNVGFNAITAITNALVSDVLTEEWTRLIVEQSMEEAIKAAEKKGVILPDNIVSKTIAKTERAGKIKTSMLQDIERKKRTEIEFINGAIIRIGKEVGLYTPVNETLCGLVKLLEGGKRGSKT